MMRVFEAHLVSNLTHGLGSIGKTFFDLIDNGKLNILLSGFTCFLFYQISEIIRGKIKFISTKSNRRQSVRNRGIRLEITVQQIFKPGKNILIHILTSYKLPIVKADTMIQKYFNISGNDGTTMFINSMFQFFPYSLKTLNHDLPFPI